MRAGAVLLLCVLAWGGCAHASSTPQRPRGDALVVEMLDLSGTRRMLEQVPAQVLTSATADQDKFPAELRARLAAAITTAYRADGLYRVAHDFVKKQARPDQLAAALAMLRTPVALRFTEMEVAAGTPESQREVQAFVQGLASAPPAQARFELVDRLDTLTGSSELLTEITVQTAAAIGRGVAAARAPLTPDQLRGLDDALREMRRQVAPATRHQVLTMFLFTYRKASDADLASYVAIYEGEAGRWTARVTGAALRAALEQAAAELARRLVVPEAK